MDGVEGINLNGTDYEVQDKTARGAQSALDERVDNIGTVIEEQVTPLSDRADELETEVEAQETRIQALENLPSAMTPTLIYENESAKGAVTIPLTGANANTRWAIVELEDVDKVGSQVQWFMLRQSTQAQATKSTSAIIVEDYLNGEKTPNSQYRTLKITSGGTAFANWKLEFSTGNYIAFAKKTSGTGTAYCNPVRVWLA